MISGASARLGSSRFSYNAFGTKDPTESSRGVDQHCVGSVAEYVAVLLLEAPEPDVTVLSESVPIR